MRFSAKIVSQFIGVATVILLANVAHPQDSLNVRFVGNWPFGISYVTEIDSARSLAFCGSGGGVYILDISDPANPIKLSDNIRTRDIVIGQFYNESTYRLYIAAYGAGLEIWDLTNSLSPVKLGYYGTPDNAFGVAVAGSYAYIADADSGLRIIDVANP